MTSDEIRERFLSYFEERGHTRLPSAPLVPRNDPSTLLISAGMHPLKPYFLGVEQPPSQRLTTLPEVLPHGRHRQHRPHLPAPDVLRDARQLLGRRLLQAGRRRVRVGVLARAASASTPSGSGSRSSRATTRSGSAPTRRRSRRGCRSACRASGSSRSAREDNFWQAGPTGPCGPCSELYLDRGPEFGAADELPGSDGERFLEYWNLVFMQYDQEPEGVLTPLPAQNIDTGLGLNRLAAIMQGTTSVFETDQIRPLVTLGEELLGPHATASPRTTDRALRILADHTRGMSFLIADGVVPSNEDRGYVLRRLMRRAVVQGRRIGIETAFLTRFAGVVRELMGSAYPELHEQRETIEMWLRTRGGGVRPHARAGHAAARRRDRTRARGRRGGHRRRPGVPAARHLRLPVRPHARARRGGGARRRRRRASRG